jgi:TPR repeat protein
MRYRELVRTTQLGFLALALCGVGAAPSQGQFYSLEGRYECLNDPKAVCYDATSNAPAPKPAADPAPADAEPATPRAKAARARVASPSIGTAAPAIAAPTDPISAVATRLQGGTAIPGDIALLHDRAAAGDKRATELLAWCHLNGVGVPRDPVPAYLLYGLAARLGVLNAERNQAIVYETDMTSEQRQSAVLIENQEIFAAGPN